MAYTSHREESPSFLLRFLSERAGNYEHDFHLLRSRQYPSCRRQSDDSRRQFAETPTSKDSYETSDMNEKIEKADYKLGEDGNVIEFLNLNKDKNIRVEFIGDRRYTTTMSPTDRQAVAGVYELSKILSAMQQIKKEQEDANLKIGFINKKKERKAMEEAAEE